MNVPFKLMPGPWFFVWVMLAAVTFVGIDRGLFQDPPKPAVEWRVIGFSTFMGDADPGKPFLVKGRFYPSREACHRDAVRLNDRTTDLTFGCAKILAGGEW